MSAVHVFLDESGDLGWSLDQPYHGGGSSRFLTVAALIVPSDQSHLPKRFMKKLYQERKWTTPEKKWADMTPEARLEFANRAVKFREDHADFVYTAITVKKEKVAQHIRGDANKLYNFMSRLLLLDRMAAYEKVQLIPDPRSIKVKSGNSLHDYLQTVLWFEKEVKTVVTTTPLDSEHCLGLQFADMLAGLVAGHYEFQQSAPWDVLKASIATKGLFL
jgi:hypothetical protein